MTDENGEDTKLITVPVTRAYAACAHYRALGDVAEDTRNRIQHFFEHYKDMEEGKWVRFEGWRDAAEAREEVTDCIRRYQDSHPE